MSSIISFLRHISIGALTYEIPAKCMVSLDDNLEPAPAIQLSLAVTVLTPSLIDPY